MREALARLAEDFFSTLIFLAVYFATGQLLVATVVALAAAIGQVVYARARRRPLNFMAYASLALVVVLGGLTLVTHDPRFVLAKPSIAHFAIGAIMLKRGWMIRYVPKSMSERIPRQVTVAGYAWAGLMFALGIGTIVFAWIGDVKLWALYVSVVAFGAKVVALVVQYLVFWALTARDADHEGSAGSRRLTPGAPLSADRENVATESGASRVVDW
jgi:intracellular septation protein A